MDSTTFWARHVGGRGFSSWWRHATGVPIPCATYLEEVLQEPEGFYGKPEPSANEPASEHVFAI